MYLHLVKLLEDNYPEMAKRLIVVKAPSIFPILYRLCRPLLSEDMRKKIFILGSDYRTELLKFADADQLPAYLGGTRTDPDGNPRCTTMIRQGGKVPRSYYLSEELSGDVMASSVIPSGQTLSIDFRVEKIGSVIKWEFRTEECDIAFGVNFVSADGEERRPIVASKTFNSHLVTEDDSVVCSLPGTYSVVFDNSSSWMKSKKLFYSVELLEVDEEIENEVKGLYEETHP